MGTARNLALARAARISASDLHAACRFHSNRKLAELAVQITPHYSWEDIVLPADQLAYVLDHLERLVLKPVSGSGGYGILIGPQAGDEELAEARVAVATEPRAWIAQELVPLSTAPTSSDNHLAPRHLDLRPFAVNDGQQVWVMPGGLTRVALREGGLVVNSSQGGGSKDTWITLDDHRAARNRQSQSQSASTVGASQLRPGVGPGGRQPGRRPESGPGLEDIDQQQQQQQQQQQGGATC